ncbi:dual specificity protein phosphatase 1B [Selaginella moellendorffii]|uniref:dual specificity protein phosphatase 1B n=1 Tax=Selaginella moellendorffii TaxID=88036 RepID=UPI000D1C4745|nr:dual specificity protein phosphatase 1B [Selaginella moellendorffii]|eukprot:XP_024541751.1 dual specificity protein phosphatase 1B [Selaginella moellendorffii]
MRQVREWLYIGNADDAGSFVSGSRHGFTHILTLAPVCLGDGCNFIKVVPEYRMEEFDRVARQLQEKCPGFAGTQPVRKIVPLVDEESQDIAQVLRECLGFIDRGVEEGIVLVHCIGGFSRSASVVTAYLMWKEGLGMDEALESLRRCKEGIRPNAGFIKQLREFEQRGDEFDVSQDRETEHKAMEYRCKLCKREMVV